MPQGGNDNPDPWEPLNRKVFDFNNALDDAVIRPVALAYRNVVPQVLRDRLRAFVDNLAEPRIFANDLLQGRLEAAGITLNRFFLNSMVGVGGLFDIASTRGLDRQTGDFGQTLYAWGVPDGPYVVVIFFGPSNVRDTVGLGVDLYTTPPGIVFDNTNFFDRNVSQEISISLGIVDGIDLRARNIETLDQIKASAIDYYSHMRSIWRQYRQGQLNQVRKQPEEPLELEDPGATQSGGTPNAPPPAGSTPPSGPAGPPR